MAIIGADDLRTYLKLASGEASDRLALFTSGASGWLEKQIGRQWGQRLRQNELHRGRGTPYLVVRHFPIASLTALVVDTIALDVTNPDVVDIINPAQGIIARTDDDVFADSMKRNISVSYVGGPTTVPADLKLAALEVAAYVFQTTGGRMNVSDGGTAVSFVDLRVQEAAALGGKNGGFKALPMVNGVIENYRDELYDTSTEGLT